MIANDFVHACEQGLEHASLAIKPNSEAKTIALAEQGDSTGGIVTPLEFVETDFGEEKIATLPDPESSGADSVSQEVELNLCDRVKNFALEQGCKIYLNQDNEAWVTVPVNDHFEELPVDGARYMQWIHHKWLESGGQILSRHVLSATSATFATLAAFGDQRYKVYLRVAHVDGEIYVDLSNEKHQVVHIWANGWEILDQSPVKFARTAGMLPLPTPSLGGDISCLREFINAPGDDSWSLILAWILGAYSDGPFPALIVTGEQGSCKSSACRFIRQLIDPARVELAMSPRETRDVMIAAKNSHVTAFDNISSISQSLSDTLCGLSTGAAHRERKYHTNNGEESQFCAKRPVLLNGIDLSMKGDLLSRSVLVSLPAIADENRKDEKKLLAEFEAAKPEILGAIFTVLSGILKNLPTTQLKEKPRMADFALWMTAAEPALGWQPGTFMSHYDRNRDDAAELAIESDSFGTAVRDAVLNDPSNIVNLDWKTLTASVAANQTKGWPTSSKQVATRLKRLAPALRHFGIEFIQRRTGNKRYYEFIKQGSNVAYVATWQTQAESLTDSASFDQNAAPDRISDVAGQEQMWQPEQCEEETEVIGE